MTGREDAARDTARSIGLIGAARTSIVSPDGRGDLAELGRRADLADERSPHLGIGFPRTTGRHASGRGVKSPPGRLLLRTGYSREDDGGRRSDVGAPARREGAVRSTGSPSSRARRRTCRSSTRRCTDRRRADVRGELLHRPLRRGAAADQLALLRRRGRPDIPDPNKWEPFGDGQRAGTTAYVLRTGQPQLIDRTSAAELIEQGEIELVGFANERLVLAGRPAQAEGRTVGVLVVQSTAKDQYTEQDRDLLAFVGQHVGAALSRARAIEETRQRNAELALDQQRPGGARRRARTAGHLRPRRRQDPGGLRRPGRRHRHLRRGAGLIHFPYTIERGVRFPDEPHRADRLPQARDGDARAADDRRGHPTRSRSATGNPFVLSGEPPKSRSSSPRRRRRGHRRHLPPEPRPRARLHDADQRLLTTLAGSLSVALENARLVHETASGTPSSR